MSLDVAVSGHLTEQHRIHAALPTPSAPSFLHTLTMSFMNWLQAKKSNVSGKGRLARARKSFGQTTLPLISPRKGRRILRREQLFSVVRESLIRAGVLSTSYEFKVLTLDANGDCFLVLIDLALPAEGMPDEYLLEIERWIQQSAKARHGMLVRSVYWRRRATHDQVGVALRAAVSAQTRRDAEVFSPTSIPKPNIDSSHAPMQALGDDELAAFRDVLQSAAKPSYPSADEARLPVPESHSDFAALSETQHGKL
jgi:hypothetical protein